MAQDKYVAIIGGGIGGLSVAWYLHGQTSPDGQFVYRCEVFEKQGRLGGNGLSAYFDQPYAKPFADLGVNDFNLTTYTHMRAILDELEKSHPVPNAPLTDTDCFFTVRGEAGTPVVFTSQDLANPTTDLTRAIADDEKKFAALAMPVMQDQKYARMSVGEFLETERFSAEFRDYYILPRINGMYFMGETVPQDMPIRGVMNYYVLQEGIAAGTPNRRYFERGCSQWFQQLRAALGERGVVFHLNDAPTVAASATAPPRVQSRGSRRLEWDAVVLAVAADEVAAVVTDGLPSELPALLAAFRYINAIAVAHEYDEVMPAERANWRTYNIRIFPPQARLLRPYTISYVETMHQGAPNADPPTWFVTENPPVPIPDDRIRDMVDPDTGERTRAVTYFRHNTVTVGTMDAQAALPALQGHNGLWYTGGWTNGAGLHEQILAASSEVALKLSGRFPVGQPLHTYTDRDPHHVPRYLREVLERGAAEAASAPTRGS